MLTRRRLGMSNLNFAHRVDRCVGRLCFRLARFTWGRSVGRFRGCRMSRDWLLARRSCAA